MGKLQVSRFERLAARTYSIKGPGALVDLDETVLGVINLERQGGAESWLMQGWETFARCLATGAGGAGQYSWILLSNPVGSGRIIVVDGWQRNNTNEARVFVTRGIPPAFVLGGPGIGLDTRIPQARGSTGDTYYAHSNIVTFGTCITQQGTAEYSGDQPIILGPDGSICWRAVTANQDLSLGFRWGEREAQPFELQ